MMEYIDILKSSPIGGEKVMWGSVERISDFLCNMKKEHPDMVSNLLKSEYESLNGKRMNEMFARMAVSKMHHTENGKKVSGEVVTVSDAMSILEGMTAEEKEAHKWDAYAGANGYMHDLASTGMSKDAIMKAAKHFWFHDEDFPEDDKVYWYYSSMMF